MLQLGATPWPRFLDHDAIVNEFWGALYEVAAAYQFALVERSSNTMITMGNSVPIIWDGDPRTLPGGGIDALLSDGISALRRGTSPTAASALMIVVGPDWLRRGVSGACIRAMAGLVASQGLSDLVAPVRPTHKRRYPLIPMDRNARWRRPDGSLFDPWLRVHEQMGGQASGAGLSPLPG
jgi:hypothetical protein